MHSCIIGNGSGGTVIRISHDMVVKICDNKPSQFLLSLTHPNLVKCHGIKRCDDAYQLTMSYVGNNHLNDINGSDLFSYLSVTTKELEPDVVITPILCVIEYLHEQMITHNDIKEENICIDNCHHITLIDVEGMIQHLSYVDTISHAQFGGTYPPFSFPMNPFAYDIKCIGHVIIALNKIRNNPTYHKVAMMMIHGLLDISHYKRCWIAHHWSCLLENDRCKEDD